MKLILVTALILCVVSISKGNNTENIDTQKQLQVLGY